MKAPRRALRLVAAGVLLFGVAAGLHAWFTPRLPHIKLKNGGEFQVLQARYSGRGENLAFQRAPEWKFRIWEALPKRLQTVIPHPEEGVRSLGADDPAVSIWCLWNRPQMHPANVHEVGDVGVMPDNGKAFTAVWGMAAHGYQELLIGLPPRDSRYLRIELPDPWESATPERVSFTISNPAYHRP